MDYCSLHDWATGYLTFAQERFPAPGYRERVSVFKRFLASFKPNSDVSSLSVQEVKAYLWKQRCKRTGHASNKDRKFLAAAWEWGKETIHNFPADRSNPFRAIKKCQEDRSPRYVPPEEDFWKMLEMTRGQDKVMLFTFLQTAARRKEIFNLKWADIDFSNDQIRFWTMKREGGGREHDLIPMTRELKSVLMQWWRDRPIKGSEFVFVSVDERVCCRKSYGKPFVARQQLVPRLCEKAGVKPFGFHAIRHLTASILYHNGCDQAVIQAILRHKSATTTARYMKRMGLNQVREALDKALVCPANKLLDVKPDLVEENHACQILRTDFTDGGNFRRTAS